MTERAVSQLSEQSAGPDGAPADDELSDRALDAVVGGLSVDAALSRAAAFDSDLAR